MRRSAHHADHASPHTMTHYDTLLLEGVDREVARRMVQPKINAMIDAWKERQT
ncbi:DUF2293 domain-containing protein [Ensifer adhaerens]|uniref:DUF2293 domain-containing protein n=1 Tax=Ensifer adhaerens TaxID=106592 RepID=UPI0009EC4646